MYDGYLKAGCHEKKKEKKKKKIRLAADQS